MDPLTALGLAANVVQFIDFGTSLISGTLERYRSATGTSIGNSELESITEDVKQLSIGLEANTKGSSKHETALKNLSGRCKDAADELLAVLVDLKVKGKHKKWESFKQAVRSIDKEKKIQVFGRGWKPSNGISFCALQPL